MAANMSFHREPVYLGQRFIQTYVPEFVIKEAQTDRSCMIENLQLE
jgi:hypothetical protein